MLFIGRSGDEVLFSAGGMAVIVNEKRKLVSSVGSSEALVASFSPSGDQTAPNSIPYELAVAATTDLDIKVFSNNDRLYTIPKAVQAEAKRSLEWHKKEHRGGTPVGLNTARTLARGGQIGIQKIRHIAKYFPRHQVDKKGKGYEPGEPNYPSNGRIAWALWGGDAAERWASAIVERENKKAQANSITASYSHVMSGYDSPGRIEFEAFLESEQFPVETAPQFHIRIRLDSGKVDRVYKVIPDGACFVWDDGMWEDLGNVNHDFETYDRSLDDPYDQTVKMHVPVDLKTSIILCGMFDSNPFEPVSISQLQPEEAQLFVDQVSGVDWGLIDAVLFDNTDNYVSFEDFSGDSITADGAPVGGDSVDLKSTDASKDGKYTPEERSSNASSQVRNSTGEFAKSGGRVVIGGNAKYSGTVESANSDTQTLKIKLDNGNFVDVPGNTTEPEDTFVPVPQQKSVTSAKDITRNILGQPRSPIDSPIAKITEKLSSLKTNQLKTILSDQPLWAADARASLTTPTDRSDLIKGLMDKQRPNAYNDPSLSNFLNKSSKSVNGVTLYPNDVWYKSDSRGVKQETTEKIKLNKGLTSAAESGTAINELTPDTSDVPPIYMAIVSPDDPQAVMDLVSLIPATKTSTNPMTFIRKPGKWEKNEQVLNDLNSPTPPPVIVLDDATLETVLEQVDSIKPMTSSAYDDMDMKIVAVMAAGGIDKNKGNAEDLRQYWLHGKGAAKIRWNTAGDWTRCVRNLSKFMGPRAKGYCALRHKEATGMWTGDKEHQQMFGKKGKVKNAFSSDFILTSEAVIASATIRARAEDARARVFGETPVSENKGAEFFIPLVIPEGVESGDGRKFDAGAISMRELPLPFLWQIKTGEGHSGSVVVGTITKMERVENGIGNAYGHFDTGEYGKEAERLVRGGFIRGVSADLDMFEAKEQENAAEGDADGKVGAGKMKITKARVMAVTLVPKPAYQECKVELVDEMGREQEEEVIQDGVYVEGVNPLDASALIACGMVAGAIPVTPPKEWFNNPGLKKPTALTVTDDGKVFGHIAAWHVDHIGMAYGTRPPRSKSKYAFFHTGIVRTEEGADMPVGQLTLAGGHAGLEASAQEAVRHYDDTASAVADVHAGEDAYGIWVSGALRPGTTPEQIRALRASAPSGDWRPIKGALELVAVCQVNVPGFPIARARVASGQVMALVAAGASVLAQLKHDPLAELNSRVDKLEAPLVAAATDARTRMQAMTAAIKAGELSSKIKAVKDADSAYMLQTLDTVAAELAIISHKERMKLADSKKALPDGSFPIRNVGDLRNAVHAYGRSTPGKRGAVRRHIVNMARQLDKTDILPDNWKEASESKSVVASLRDRIAIVESIVAAGGADKNRGNAETLRQYWSHGEGAAKIRWGTPGDWKRCVRHLGKYMGVRAKGYCQLRHKDALGFYTSTHAKMDNKSKNLSETEENISTFETQVSEADMAMDMDNIYQEEDGVFEPDFKPADHIIVILNGGDTEQEEAMAITAASEISEADIKGLTDKEVELLKKEVKSGQKADSKPGIYTAKTQPRDDHGKFRQVLARLKVDLGDSGSDEALKKIEQVENLGKVGNYAGAANAAGDLLNVIDRLDSGALNRDSLENVRKSAGELGSVIANLPFAFGQAAEKIRFSDVPPALGDLMKKMITRVEAKIGKKDADIATKDLKSFMSGGDYYNQSEISSQMSKLLRLLT